MKKSFKIKLQGKYILFIIFIHMLLLLLSFQFLNVNKTYFFISEAVIIFSIFISVRLYNLLIKPIKLISSGAEMLKEKDFSTRLAPAGQYEIDILVDVYNKMIDQLREERLRQVEQDYFLEKLIEASPSGIIVLDYDNKVSAVNPAAHNMLKLNGETLQGKPLGEINSRLSKEMLLLKDGETRIINLSGSQVYKCFRSFFLDRGFQRHFYIIEEMTQEVLKTERKAYEKVVRMMSHEINNSIGAVNSFMQSFMNYKCQLKAEDQTDFENSLGIAIERNNRLNKFMSNFSNVVKIPKPRKEQSDLTLLLRNIEKLFGNELNRRNIKWIWQPEAIPFQVNIDVEQIEQVLVNIIKNSIEAIEHDGIITVKTEDGRQKRLTISDTGKGIKEENRNQIFSPFYSTKTNGQGIGLTLTREVLLNHNFNFSLETIKPGETIFTIEFS